MSSATNQSIPPHPFPNDVDHDEDQIRFDPPLYRQRYLYTLDFIQRDSTLSSMLDIGCGSCQLLAIGKYRNSHIQLAAAIDIVHFQLDEACFVLKPLSVEYLVYRRETPLHMYIVHGDATKTCNCFVHFDVVTLIEVIEHLYQTDLDNLMQHIFAHIRPRLIIVTTPNADFNVLFSTMPYGQFRHADHKFEFTRAQFNSWAQQIADEHGYTVEFDGLGQAPSGEQHRDLGSCTQIALFHLGNQNDRTKLTSNEFCQRLSQCTQHNLVQFIDYPFGVDKPNEFNEQVRYILEMYRLIAEEKARNERTDDEETLLTIDCRTLIDHPRLTHFRSTREELVQAITHAGFRMLDNELIVLSEDPLATSSHSDDENDNLSHVPEIDSQPRNLQSTAGEESWD